MSRKRKHGAGRRHRRLPRLVCRVCGARFCSVVRKEVHPRQCPDCADRAFADMAVKREAGEIG